jgi:hypothetical protein
MSDSLDPFAQPVSIHQPMHKHHGGLAVVAVMLGVFLVVSLLALGYVVKEYVVVTTDSDTMTLDEQRAEIDRRVALAAQSLPPFVYNVASSSLDGTSIRTLNPSTGEDLAVSPIKESERVSVFAVPQVGYDGRIFAQINCSGCDNPYLNIKSIDLKNNNLEKPVPLAASEVLIGAAKVSPDQTRVAVAHYPNLLNNDPTEGKFIVYDLVSGRATEIGKLAAGEYHSALFGGNTFATAAEFNLNWLDRNCFSSSIFTEFTGDNVPVEAGFNQYKETRTFCVETE